MCGFVGFIGGSEFNANLKDSIEKMTESLTHRGPDSQGTWLCEDNNIALGHTRLAIQDLSSNGHQPMISPSSRYIIVFNGEIYNHLELRKRINEHSQHKMVWNGLSDTETLLSAIEAFGISRALEMSIGMFAFALWDEQDQTLLLSRDRAGEKPLYYGYINNSLVFGSELKALKKFPNFESELSQNAMSHYFKYGYIPAPFSIYENIFKVEPGTFLEFDMARVSVNDFQKRRYWALEDEVIKSTQQFYSNFNQAKEDLELRISDAVKSQLISDVPLGVFLSGGIDSSLVAALAQKNSDIPIKTFTIGFENSEYDESEFAEDVAKYLGTNHKKYQVSDLDVLKFIPRLPEIYDEPFADSSQIPTYFVCKAAKEEVTVALSGDGGDELFGGYNRYIFSSSIWSKVSWLPKFIRKFIGTTILWVPVKIWDQLKPILFFKDYSLFGNKAHKVGLALKHSNNLDDFCLSFSIIWEDTNEILNNFDSDIEYSTLINSPVKNILDQPVNRMMFHDFVTYLPDDILCKVDRASMAVSLETRAPFLDKKVISEAWKVPLSSKIKSGEGKWLVKEILYKHVPKKLIDRPKAGFALPLSDWLRGPLKNWAENLLNKQVIDEQGFLNSASIDKIWNQHLSGEYDWTSKLWTILMFQAWLEKQ